ncbi:Ferritin [Anaerohalosphaera lusitana]|uniref:Ferritin n=1 Tax=Anaerohalosphaera lusitana TaxID=1936003 RepID=A0A1U9NP32_9BACT|nr:ferritin [Anaerohalosphaera lusitana]AQT69494.1 Ferritin [Anaerohalosphaera lusitana]
MVPEKIEKALNSQINAELYSGYMYLSMSAYFEGMDLDGFANWMRVQAQEEQSHAMKIYDFVNFRGGKVNLTAIDGPPTEWASPLAVLEATLEHEQKVTGLINKLVKLAREEDDYATENFLQWFVDEQVEEEDNAGKLVSQLKLVEGNPQALFMMDRELGQRTFTPEEAEGEA